MGIIAGWAKLELEAMKIQEESGLSIEEAREVAKTLIKNRLISGAASIATDPTDYDITSERGCRRRILAHWSMIKSRYGENADGRQVLIVLRQFAEPDDPPLVLKTVQNKLRQLRKENLIP